MPDVRPGPLHELLKLSTRVRTRGPKELAALATTRLREAVSSSEELIVYARDTGGSIPERDGLTFREASAADGRLYARDIGTDSPRTFKARLSHATRCFVVADSTRLLHATWMTTAAAWTREVRGYFSPPRGDGYIYESFTRADARGRGVYPFALAGIAAWLKEHDIERVWVAVEAHNQPSIKAVTKAGFEPRDRIRYRRRWGRIDVDAPDCTPGQSSTLCLARRPPGDLVTPS